MRKRLRICGGVFVCVFICVFILVSICRAGVEESWIKTKQDNNLEAYQEFLEKYPNSKYADEVKDRIDIMFSIIDDLKKKGSRGKIIFGGGIQAPVEVILTTKEKGERVLSCPLFCQENAIRIFKEDGKLNGKGVLLKYYKGYPFIVHALKVDNTKMLYDITTIKIESLESGILLPERESAVPLEVNITTDGNLQMDQWVRAIGVTWEFTTRGIKVKTDSIVYVSEEKGAKIKFTKYGLVFEKIKIIKSGKKNS